MVILFREDTRSIARFSKLSDSHDLVFLIKHIIDNIYSCDFGLFIRKYRLSFFRTIIEPFLYKYCVSVQYVYTFLSLMEEKNSSISHEIFLEKYFTSSGIHTKHYILCLCLVFLFVKRKTPYILPILLMQKGKSRDYTRCLCPKYSLS